MNISAILNIAASGMQANSRKLATTAQNVANAATPGYDRMVASLSADASGGVTATIRSSGGVTLPDTSNIDLGQEMLDAMEAEIGFKTNAAVWETGADLWDVLATIKRD